MTRSDALKAAEEMVARLSPVPTRNGYADGADKALPTRVEAILRIADWLASDPTDIEIRAFGQAEATSAIRNGHHVPIGGSE